MRLGARTTIAARRITRATIAAINLFMGNSAFQFCRPRGRLKNLKRLDH